VDAEIEANHDRPAGLTIRQARPIILSRGARKATKARWAGVSPKAETEFIAKLNAARAAKRKHHARMKRAA
jgi:hypothetical protein